MQRLPAVRLGPRYRALSLLAKGGMGAVYLGRRFDQPDRLVAIKVMHGHIADNPESVSLFIDEARIGTRIQHPNVVSVLDCDVGDDMPFIVMEYVPGLSWARLLRRFAEVKELPPIDVVARVLHDGCRGLAAAHAVGAVHRDVSPHNLLVSTDGRTRVTDFGIATFTGRISGTSADEVRGKFNYMSPEQLSKTGVDARADVFAAGIVLWEGLTGKTLFDGTTQSETLAKVLAEPIDPPSTHRPEIPLELEDACLKALERVRERRWQSATELADALAKAVPLASDDRMAEVVARLGAEDLARHRIATEESLTTAPAVMLAPRAEALPAARYLAIAAGAGILLVLGLILGRVSRTTTSAPPPASSSAVPAQAPSPPVDSAPAPIVSTIPTVAAAPAVVPEVKKPTPAATPTPPRKKPARPAATKPGDFVPGEL
jgi:serine/threonine-protein kinase